jgi:hypothetical protein
MRFSSLPDVSFGLCDGDITLRGGLLFWDHYRSPLHPSFRDSDSNFGAWSDSNFGGDFGYNLDVDTMAVGSTVCPCRVGTWRVLLEISLASSCLRIGHCIVVSAAAACYPNLLMDLADREIRSVGGKK